MPAHKKQFCIQGHDTHVVGRDSGRGCKACANERKKDWNKTEKAKDTARLYYLDNYEQIRDNEYARRAARAEIIADIKIQAGCADCGYDTDSVALDFDHVRGEKLFGIGAGRGGGRPLEVLLAEIEKCEVVCANCHRIRTKKRRQFKARKLPVRSGLAFRRV